MLIAYQSFEGRLSDSPLALFRALRERLPDARHVWLVDPAHEHPEAGAQTIPWGSDECIDALEAADLIVANTHTDLDWRKRPGATYLQTWHGTPLKRIHRDVMWAPPGRHERLSRDVEQWDLLVSPNRASTPRLRQAFAYEGEVIETGYPRNDVLLSAGRERLRARVRAQLGIADGHTAVLYAPTWRDDAVLPEGGKDFALELDVDAFEARFGADHVLLLRLHYLLTGRLEAMKHPSLRDVSWYPDVAELYLAADVLVTDYSSTMFDFAITGRPQLFFTYDLDDYGDRLRGFYFDLAPVAPGPLLATNSEVFDALADLPAVAAAHLQRYEAFREQFCHLEDGRASERVVERLLR
jgi:CDP-glycerol glycerophosphotransferase